MNPKLLYLGLTMYATVCSADLGVGRRNLLPRFADDELVDYFKALYQREADASSMASYEQAILPALRRRQDYLFQHYKRVPPSNGSGASSGASHQTSQAGSGSQSPKKVIFLMEEEGSHVRFDNLPASQLRLLETHFATSGYNSVFKLQTGYQAKPHEFERGSFPPHDPDDESAQSRKHNLLNNLCDWAKKLPDAPKPKPNDPQVWHTTLNEIHYVKVDILTPEALEKLKTNFQSSEYKRNYEASLRDAANVTFTHKLKTSEDVHAAFVEQVRLWVEGGKQL